MSILLLLLLLDADIDPQMSAACPDAGSVGKEHLIHMLSSFLFLLLRLIILPVHWTLIPVAMLPALLSLSCSEFHVRLPIYEGRVRKQREGGDERQIGETRYRREKVEVWVMDMRGWRHHSHDIMRRWRGRRAMTMSLSCPAAGRVIPSYFGTHTHTSTFPLLSLTVAHCPSHRTRG